jgi:hypothetical protein
MFANVCIHTEGNLLLDAIFDMTDKESIVVGSGLPVIPNTTNVIGDIGHRSLQVASLIYEYMNFS